MPVSGAEFVCLSGNFDLRLPTVYGTKFSKCSKRSFFKGVRWSPSNDFMFFNDINPKNGSPWFDFQNSILLEKLLTNGHPNFLSKVSAVWEHYFKSV